MRTENTLKLISQIPLLILFVVSSYFLYTSYINYKNVTILNSSLNENDVLSQMSSAIAAERDLTAMYVTSNGAIASDVINERRAITDSSFSSLKNHYNTNPTHRTVAISSVINHLENLQAIREQVDSLSIEIEDVFFNYYNIINSAILNKMHDETSQIIANSQITSLNTALIASYNDMEYTSQERGLVAGILGLYEPISYSALGLWIDISSKSSTLNSISIQPIQTQRALDTLFNSENSIRVLEDIELTKAEIMLASQNGEFLVDPLVWFNMMDDRIKIFSQASSIIKTSLQSEVDKFDKFTIYQFAISAFVWIISIILLTVGFIMSKNINGNIKELGKVFGKVEELAGVTEKLDLHTAADTDKAYGIINTALENIAEEKRKAEEASAAKSIFLANMSHEIRTPLNGIIGFTELLKNTDLDGEKLEFVEVIEKSSENLLDIINNVLDLSKIESNKVEIDEIPFLPIPEFENAIEVYGPKATEKNIKLSSYISPELTDYLKGDITKIKEVIINLLSNAVKFTPQNGAIHVTIDRKPSQKQGYVNIYVSVEDSGIGIQESKLNDIFNAFSQADSTITRKYGGTGLGLTISSQYVNLMGGQLQVDSKEGVGSKFFFTVEMIETPSSEIRLQNRYSNYTCAVLVKPQNLKNHEKSIRAYLEYFGATARSFSTFDELKELIYKAGVNSVIIDLDNLSDEELSEYKKVKLPTLIILRPQDQKRGESIANEYITTIFEPINITKLVKFLDIGKVLIPKELKTQPAPVQVTKTDPVKAPIFDNLRILQEETNMLKQDGIDIKDNDAVPTVDIKNRPGDNQTAQDYFIGIKGINEQTTTIHTTSPSILSSSSERPKTKFEKVSEERLENNTKFQAKVLVAEDNEINQKLIKRTLQDIGLEITTVQNGLLAFEERQKGGYDIVFMDIAMPVMDGVEATHKMIGWEKTNNIPHIPIVAITANALKGDRERFMSEGLDEYITKPIKKDSILRVLNMFIPNKAVRDDSLEKEMAEKFASIIQDEPTKIQTNNTTLLQDNKTDIEVNTPQNSVVTTSDSDNEEPLSLDISFPRDKVIKKVVDILVFKKSPIETRIFSDVIKKYSNSVDSTNSIEEFKSLILVNNYKLIIVDKEVTIEPSLKSIISNIKNSNNETKVALFYEIDEPTNIFDGIVDTVTKNLVTKSELLDIVRKYIN